MIPVTKLYNSENPMVSICCSTFNHDKFIEDALNGFLMQETNFPVEILINDDCSSDKTVEHIQRYVKKYPKLIKPVYQQTNQYSKGIKPLTQALLPRCKGKYTAFCEGDDFWTDKFKLQKQVDFLENNPEYAMCYTNFSIVSENKEIIDEACLNKIYRPATFNYLDILENFTPKFLTLVFRTNIVQNKVPKEISLVRNGDTFICALLTQKSPGALLNFDSGSYRLNQNSVASMKSTLHNNKMLIETLNVLKNYFTLPKEQKAIKSHLARKYYKIAVFQFQNFNWFDGFKALVISIFYSRKPYFKKMVGKY